MRYCTQCHRLLTMEELTHQTGGRCFDCFWPSDNQSGSKLSDDEAESQYWLSEEAMSND